MKHPKKLHTLLQHMNQLSTVEEKLEFVYSVGKHHQGQLFRYVYPVNGNNFYTLAGREVTFLNKIEDNIFVDACKYLFSFALFGNMWVGKTDGFNIFTVPIFSNNTMLTEPDQLNNNIMPYTIQGNIVYEIDVELHSTLKQVISVIQATMWEPVTKGNYAINDNFVIAQNSTDTYTYNRSELPSDWQSLLLPRHSTMKLQPIIAMTIEGLALVMPNKKG